MSLKFLVNTRHYFGVPSFRVALYYSNAVQNSGGENENVATATDFCCH
jgi:hypothetical protein